MYYMKDVHVIDECDMRYTFSIVVYMLSCMYVHVPCCIHSRGVGTCLGLGGGGGGGED